MNIDRINYEEYFLLYADNELTDSEKAEVLMFVKDNKDLEQEFRMIHHTICKPDGDVGLADKSFLLRGSEKAFINEKNYEEIFVLYHDNELTAAQKKETEDFLSLHTSLKDEFRLIGLARLIPEEAVVFQHKKTLYRKEKTGKVVPIIFWRSIVAAVFIGCGLWITQLYVHKDVIKPTVAVKSAPAKQTAPLIDKKPAQDKKKVDAVVQSTNNKFQSSRKELNPVKKKEEKAVTAIASEIAPKKKSLAKTLVKAEKAGDEEVTKEPQEKISDDQLAIVNEGIKNIPKEQILENNTIEPSKELTKDVIKATEKVVPVPYAQHASFVSETNDNSQNYVFYDITTEEFKKTKVGGFLKKVKRVIARNNPISRLLPGDDRQVVTN